MKYEDLHPVMRWVFRNEKDRFNDARQVSIIRQVWGPLDNGKLSSSMVACFLAGINIGVAVVIFNLTSYIAFIVGMLFLASEFWFYWKYVREG